MSNININSGYMQEQHYDLADESLDLFHNYMISYSLIKFSFNLRPLRMERYWPRYCDSTHNYWRFSGIQFLMFLTYNCNSKLTFCTGTTAVDTGTGDNIWCNPLEKGVTLRSTWALYVSIFNISADWIIPCGNITNIIREWFNTDRVWTNNNRWNVLVTWKKEHINLWYVSFHINWQRYFPLTCGQNNEQLIQYANDTFLTDTI